MGTILAIDPGNIESGYVVVEHDFSADMWAAMAVAVTYFDKYIRGIQL